MFEKFLSQNLESFRQRYEGTYGFYRNEHGRRLLVKLAAITSEQVDFVDRDGIQYHMRPDRPDDIGFEFIPPKSAWYNTAAYGAVYTQRLAQRQYQRGITSKTIEANSLSKGTFQPRRIDFDLLAMVYEKAITPRAAFSTFKDGQSLAISGQFALDGYGTVRLLKEEIGTYKYDGDKKFTFQLTEPQLWKTEISDAITAMGASASIS